jgi:hypothetical protein
MTLRGTEARRVWESEFPFLICGTQWKVIADMLARPLGKTHSTCDRE